MHTQRLADAGLGTEALLIGHNVEVLPSTFSLTFSTQLLLCSCTASPSLLLSWKYNASTSFHSLYIASIPLVFNHYVLTLFSLKNLASPDAIRLDFPHRFSVMHVLLLSFYILIVISMFVRLTVHSELVDLRKTGSAALKDKIVLKFQAGGKTDKWNHFIFRTTAHIPSTSWQFSKEFCWVINDQLRIFWPFIFRLPL